MNKQKHGGNSRTAPESTTIELVMSEESILRTYQCFLGKQ